MRYDLKKRKTLPTCVFRVKNLQIPPYLKTATTTTMCPELGSRHFYLFPRFFYFCLFLNEELISLSPGTVSRGSSSNIRVSCASPTAERSLPPPLSSSFFISTYPRRNIIPLREYHFALTRNVRERNKPLCRINMSRKIVASWASWSLHEYPPLSLNVV